VAVGGIRCSEVCTARSVIVCSHVQHFKKSEQWTIKKTRLFLVTLQRERKFYATVHSLHVVLLKSQPLNKSLYKVPQPLCLIRFSVTVLWDPMPCPPNYTVLHRTRPRLDTNIENFQPSIMVCTFQHFSLQVVCPVRTHNRIVPTLVVEPEDTVILVVMIFSITTLGAIYTYAHYIVQ
jgi:hypothetical protein